MAKWCTDSVTRTKCLAARGCDCDYRRGMDPQQAAIAREFDEYSDRYEQQVDNAISFSPFKADFFIRAKAEHLLRLARATQDLTQAKVLDVGCGVGLYHELLTPEFGSVTGIDVSADAVRQAELLHPSVAYESYDGGQLPFETGTFETVFASCVLHHVPVGDWALFVSEMCRVTAPGGITVLFEHNSRNPLTRKAVRDCPFDEDAVLVDISEARSLFADAGRSNVEIEHILTIPAISGPLKWLDTQISRLHFGTQYCLSSRG